MKLTNGIVTLLLEIGQLSVVNSEIDALGRIFLSHYRLPITNLINGAKC
ncbi:MAG: hypothetical protein LDL41_16030 [Coleofasciculus sp. S288]|nr:hypothetical protein [Coleofasciculus sp. S288]